MRLDLRYPIGLMFAAFGALLVGYGITHPNLRAPLTPVNLNLYAGFCLLAFGVSLLLLARRARR